MRIAERRFQPGQLAQVGYAWAAAGFVAACAAQPARAPHPTRPLGEARARALIASVLESEGTVPTVARRISLPRARALEVDVGVSGRAYGVAFVTAEERPLLGTAVPAPDLGSNALQLVRDASNPDVRILVLHDTNFMTDEQVGEDRDVSSVIVEQRLQRDVRDFLAEAKRNDWP